MKLDDREIAAAGGWTDSTGSDGEHDVADVLQSLTGFIRRFVVLTEAELTAISLWVFHTHAFTAAEATPYLSITSAEKESGKTRLLEVLALLVAKPWFTGRVTPAVLARKVDKEAPTLLLDESDAAFNGDREYAEVLRGVLNSGHRRGGSSSVCVGQGAAMSYKDLSTFCAKAIAGIGKLPDTVASRSIPIRLKRKAPGECVERFRHRDALEGAKPIQQSIASLAEYYCDRLALERPELPDALGDRAADCWEPLLAIADLAGGSWRMQAREAALECSGATDEDDSTGVQLLADCHRVFADRDRLSTKTLIEMLCEDEEAPWSTWHKGARISPRSLARILTAFGIRSRSMRFEDHDGTAKGYMREQFEDAWKRYPPPRTRDLSGTTAQPAWLSEKQPFSFPAHVPPVPDTRAGANPHGETVVPDVPDRNGAWGREGPVLLLGDSGYLNFVADRHRCGHITTAEALEAEQLHRLVTVRPL